MQFTTFDFTVFFGYIFLIIGFGIWIANREKSKSTADYFLASKSLPWWAVGGSLIASNISTEQIMGMNGSGFEIGLAIATYELMAAATLMIVAKFFLPVFIEKGIYTMPQFLEKRYDGRVRSIMSVFWVALFVFINITTVLYLGGLAIEALLGVPLFWGIVGLALYSASFSIFGGLKAVVWTDVAQVVVLVLGGFLAAYFVLDAVSDGNGMFAGLKVLIQSLPEHFEMIYEPSDTYVEVSSNEVKSRYNLLPGFSVLFGGVWIANLYYWGNNQYIIQRALASKTLKEGQKGIAFAAFLKLLMPLIVVIPGIAAYQLQADIAKADQAFPWVIGNFLGPGIRGLVMAALAAAIGSSISSMVNSASTIFTLDIYKKHIKTNASDNSLVRIGQITSAVCLIIGVILAPFLGYLDQAFQYIQEYTGFISPGVVAIFIFGMFWRPTTANAALITVLISIPLSVITKIALPELPFIDRMAISFLVCCITLVGISLAEADNSQESTKGKAFRIGLIVATGVIALTTGVKILAELPALNWIGYLTIALAIILIGLLLGERKVASSKAFNIDSSLFRTSTSFNLTAITICVLLAAFYAFFG